VGLPYPVTVRHGIVERFDPATGRVLGHGIPDLDGLLAAISMVCILHPARLSGQEIRFLRKSLGTSGVALAGELAVDPTAFARCEEQDVPLEEQTERLLRLLVAERLKSQAPAIDYDPGAILRLRLTRSADPPRLVLERIVFKDGLTRKRSETWDALPAAA
jgi:DNA-binding transcriptional regulator YiaG